ncbi:hypothetical protein ACHAPQ_008850 [Fusarium lateritium]
MTSLQLRISYVDQTSVPESHGHKTLATQPPQVDATLNTQSFPFTLLPQELKLEVMDNTIPKYTLPERIRANGNILVREERKKVPKLLLSCKPIREIVKHMRRVVAVASDSRVLFTFDLRRDTLLVQGMRLPRFEVEGKGKLLPVRRLITRTSLPVVATGVQLTPHQLRHMSEEPWRGLPFQTSLPILSKLPLVEEIFVVNRFLPFNWDICGFQVFGPDIVGVRTDEENWGLARAYDYPKAYEAANYFLENGIASDTGIRWKLPVRQEGQVIDMISDEEDLSLNFPGQHCIPYIGFHGYSKGTRSLGGKWAGFLYDAATESVMFRPLNWDEVHEFYRDETRHPHFIAKIWFSKVDGRPEKDDHRGWVDVKAPEEDDPEWVEQLATT